MKGRFLNEDENIVSKVTIAAEEASESAAADFENIWAKKIGWALQMNVYLLNYVENNMVDKEINDYDQFVLLPQLFLNSSAADASEWVCMYEIDWFGLQLIQQFFSLIAAASSPTRVFSGFLTPVLHTTLSAFHIDC